MPGKVINWIALADDDVDDRDVFTEVCKDLDPRLHVMLYNDGKELLDYLNSPKARIPVILFLDINMPFKNGFESLEEIRSNPKLKSICIIMYSTSSSPSDIAKAKKLGAEGFFQKPSNYGKLKSTLKKLLDIDWTNPCSEFDDLNFLVDTSHT